MNRASLINVGLQLSLAGLRYVMMGLVYAQSELKVVGHINAMLTYVTAMTFVAGLELHHIANRPLLLGTSNVIRLGLDRISMALAVITLLSLMSSYWLFQVAQSFEFIIFILLVGLVEYIGLELGRLLIARSRYHLVAVCGFIRSVSPFAAIFFSAPKLESMLFSWLLGSFFSALIQYWVLKREAFFSVSWNLFGRKDFQAAIPLFVAGVSMALLPTLERFLISSQYSAEDLGQYSLAMALVSVCELLLLGGMWQPFVSKIMANFSNPDKLKPTIGWLVLIIVAVYALACCASLLFSEHLFKILNKQPLPSILLIGIFFIGVAKSLYSVVFYVYYANGAENSLPWVQVQLLVGLVVGVYVCVGINFSLGQALFCVAALWVSLLTFSISGVLRK